MPCVTACSCGTHRERWAPIGGGRPPGADELKHKLETLVAKQKTFLPRNYAGTGQEGPRYHKARASVYQMLIARQWKMPRTFDAEDENAHYASLFAHWPAAERGIPISRALSRARHPAVPAYMSDIATKVAHSAFLMGPVKCKGLRAKCHCDRTTDETVDHAYQKCARVARLWTLVLAAWARVTGETRLKASDTQVTCLGDRTGTWVDETEQSEFGAYSEPWAVIHKATLWVIKQERDKAVESLSENVKQPW